MKSLKTTSGYMVRLDKDEKLIDSLTAFVHKNNIKGAWVNALGAASGVELGYYDLQNQEYIYKTYTELCEITNLTGNISRLNGEPSIHLHGTFAGNDYRAFGGHVKELVVGGTCEIYLTITGKNINRVFDQDVGLNILSL